MSDSSLTPSFLPSLPPSLPCAQQEHRQQLLHIIGRLLFWGCLLLQLVVVLQFFVSSHQTSSGFSGKSIKPSNKASVFCCCCCCCCPAVVKLLLLKCLLVHISLTKSVYVRERKICHRERERGRGTERESIHHHLGDVYMRSV